MVENVGDLIDLLNEIYAKIYRYTYQTTPTMSDVSPIRVNLRIPIVIHEQRSVYKRVEDDDRYGLYFCVLCNTVFEDKVVTIRSLSVQGIIRYQNRYAMMALNQHLVSHLYANEVLEPHNLTFKQLQRLAILFYRFEDLRHDPNFLLSLQSIYKGEVYDRLLRERNSITKEGVVVITDFMEKLIGYDI